MMKQLSALVLLITLGTSVPQTASAQSDIIAARQANFKQSGMAMRQMRGQLGNGDYEAIAQSAEKIALWAAQMPDFFTAGSGPDTNKTNAKASIWAEFDRFTALANDNQQAALKLVKSAKSGDGSAIMADMGALGKTCGACHSQFKN